MKPFFLVLFIVGLGLLALTRGHAQQNQQYAMTWGHDTNASQATEGNWSFGGRQIVELRLSAGSGAGRSKGLMGQVKFAGEDKAMLGLRVMRASGNNFTAETKRGNEDWKPALGTWTIGHRTDHAVITVELKSPDSGKTLNGKMTYDTEGPIHIKGSLQ